MPQKNRSAFVATGLMLFALFFGAGNLIFPAMMGQQAGNHVLTAMLGFLITGAGLPLLGVIAVGFSGSRDIQEMASRVAPWYGVLFAVMLYLAIGPLFASPRTATVSFEIGVMPFLGEIDKDAKSLYLGIFSFVFFAIAFWLSISPNELVNRVGKILTPVLLLTIAILVITAAVKPMGVPELPIDDYTNKAFTKGIIEGYGTMDALASLVFAIIVIDAIRNMGVTDKKQILSLTTWAGLIAASCLAIVYVFIAYMGATSVAGLGMQESGATVLSKSATHYFGTVGQTLLAVIVFLACLSTAVGLITACGEYFNRLIPQLSYGKWVVIFTLVSFGFANVGLSEIIKLSIPALMLLYPLTIAIIALAFLHPLFAGKRIVYICTIAATAVFAIFDGWKTFFGTDSGVTKDINTFLNENLYLYDAGLGWILPAIVGFVIGVVLSKTIAK
ncbi:branched-chain amino acid transport system II carrier protein [Wielerella bovis]|uniref:branched-chain amino acid transport system II carrier protein n=1 Tax=Wielerella bovis TaxID=2917790 RepID=UPI00201A0A24|nr:branched-chain amino acid transport system II carrier protein [Wielerella bovis]ULJ61904.1 branched-chain amino acid transport system II carrier protein [Wielerella bovis]